MLKKPPPSSKADLPSLKAALQEWSSLDSFEEKLAPLRAVPPSEIFRRPEFQFYFEAWVLLRYARLRGATRLRLAPPFDGQVEVSGAIEDVEITDAIEAGRRRGAEDWEDATVRHDPVEDWDRRLNSVPAALAAVIQRKTERRYNPKPVLVIYLSIGTYGDYRRSEIESIIRTTKAAHRNTFAEIYILWEGSLF